MVYVFGTFLKLFIQFRAFTIFEPRHEKTSFLHMRKQTQISFVVTAKLISAFVFTRRIVQSLYFRNPKFQASSHLLWLYSPICVGPGLKPRRPFFLERGSFHFRPQKQRTPLWSMNAREELKSSFTWRRPRQNPAVLITHALLNYHLNLLMTKHLRKFSFYISLCYKDYVIY